MTYLPRIEVIAGMSRWTSPRTFGDPQGAILVMLLTLLALFAGLALFTIVHALREGRRGRDTAATRAEGDGGRS